MNESISYDYPQAHVLCVSGSKIARKGWNGKGIYIYFVPAASYPAQTEVAKKEFGEKVPYGAYFAIKTAQGVVEAGWRPTSPDLFAEDWYVVE